MLRPVGGLRGARPAARSPCADDARAAVAARRRRWLAPRSYVALSDHTSTDTAVLKPKRLYIGILRHNFRTGALGRSSYWRQSRTRPPGRRLGRDRPSRRQSRRSAPRDAGPCPGRAGPTAGRAACRSGSRPISWSARSAVRIPRSMPGKRSGWSSACSTYVALVRDASPDARRRDLEAFWTSTFPRDPELLLQGAQLGVGGGEVGGGADQDFVIVGDAGASTARRNLPQNSTSREPASRPSLRGEQHRLP